MKVIARRLVMLIFAALLICATTPLAVFATDAEVEGPTQSISKSKIAENLVLQKDGTYTTDITLSLPSAKESLKSDIVFVVDVSSLSAPQAVLLEILDFMNVTMKDSRLSPDSLKYGIVVYRGNAVTFLELQAVNGDTVKSLEEKISNLYTLEDESNTSQKDTWNDYFNEHKAIAEGCNFHAGLQAAYEMLGKDKDVPNSRKYVYSVMDDIGSLFNNAAGETQMIYANDKEYGFDASNRLWGYINRVDTDSRDHTYLEWGKFDWNAYYEDVKAGVGNDKGKYDVDYAKMKAAVKADSILTLHDEEFPKDSVAYVTEEDWMEEPHALGVDRAVYECMTLTKKMADEGIHCYAALDYPQYHVYDYFNSAFAYELNIVAGKPGYTMMESLYYDVFYLLAEGSRIFDSMGYVEDGYNFDFVNDPAKLTLTVGKETLAPVKIDENNYGFGPITVETDNGTEELYRYLLQYLPGEKDAEGFYFTMNEAVCSFVPVQLTYTEVLANPETDDGIYGKYDADGSKGYESLRTNNKAVLTPMLFFYDVKGCLPQSVNDGNEEFPEKEWDPLDAYNLKRYLGADTDFGVPTVSYAVGKVPSILDGDNHFAYIIGYPDQMIRPDGTITRAEVATIFFRLLKNDVRTANMVKANDFTDVCANDWYNTAISTLTKLQVLAGYPDGTFKPNDTITRAEFTAIAARFDQYKAKEDADFTDIEDHWAKVYIAIAADKGWVGGYPDGTFKPDQKISRAEAVALVNRVLDRNIEKERTDAFCKGMISWKDNMDTAKWYYYDIQEATNSHDYERYEKDGVNYEVWTAVKDNPDWAALEK